MNTNYKILKYYHDVLFKAKVSNQFNFQVKFKHRNGFCSFKSTV